jgi:hypothetical protein
MGVPRESGISLAVDGVQGRAEVSPVRVHGRNALVSSRLIEEDTPPPRQAAPAGDATGLQGPLPR